MASTSSWSSLLSIVAIALLCISHVTSFSICGQNYSVRFHRCRVSMSSIYASSSDDIKSLVAKSEMILVVPTSTVRADYIAGLKKLLPRRLEASVVPSNKMIQAVDGTAFCQLGELTGSNFCIFVDEDSNVVYEIFCKWIRSLSKSAEDEAEKEAKKTGNEIKEIVKHEFVISKKGHMMKIQA